MTSLFFIKLLFDRIDPVVRLFGGRFDRTQPFDHLSYLVILLFLLSFDVVDPAFDVAKLR